MTSTERSRAHRERKREERQRARDPIRRYCTSVIAHWRATGSPAGSKVAARASDYLARLDSPQERPQSVYTLMGMETTATTGQRTLTGDPVDLEGLALAQAAIDAGDAPWTIVRAGLDHVGRLLRPSEVKRDKDADFVAFMRLLGGTPAPDHLVTRLGEDET